MEENLGSLRYFIKELPELKKYEKIIENARYSPLRSPKITRKHSKTPESIKKKFTFESKSLVFKKKTIPPIARSSINHSVQRISAGDQLQGELMMSRRHELLRSMRQNLKNDERKNLDLSVETMGVEKVFKSFRSPARNQNLEIIKELNKIFLTQKQCRYKKLIDERYNWLFKRSVFK